MTLAEAADMDFSQSQPEASKISTNGDGSYEAPTVNLVGGDGESIVSLEELKHQAVEHAYHRCEGNVDRAAVELGIGRATMYRLLKKYELMN
jgi:transcriptional regulator of acetoin/glycerol metabolism